MIEYFSNLLTEFMKLYLLIEFIPIDINRKKKLLIIFSFSLILSLFPFQYLVFLINALLLTLFHLLLKERKFLIKIIYFSVLIELIYFFITLFLDIIIKFSAMEIAQYEYFTLLSQNTILTALIINFISFSICNAWIQLYGNNDSTNFKFTYITYILLPFLSTVSLILIQEQAMILNTSKNYLYSILISLFLFCINIFFTKIFFEKIEKESLNDYLITTHIQKDSKLAQFNQLKQANEEMLYVLHDIKEHIQLLSDSTKVSENSSYIQELQSKFICIEKHCYTDDILNYMIDEKLEIAKSNNISITVHIDRIDISFIKKDDMLLLISPLFDICFQYYEAQEEPIHFEVKNHNNLIIFYITVPFFSKKMRNAFLIQHNAMKSVVKAYNGSSYIDQKDKSIKVSILLQRVS